MTSIFSIMVPVSYIRIHPLELGMDLYVMNVHKISHNIEVCGEGINIFEQNYLQIENINPLIADVLTPKAVNLPN